MYDNFGLVKVEGASYETPGVFVKGTCAGFDVQHGFNGFLSEDSPESFADAITDAVKDYDELKKIGKNAKDTLYISWKDCTDKLLETYERIIEEYQSKQVPQNKADKE